MRIYSICLSLADLFHLVQCLQGPSMLLQKVEFFPFLWLTNIILLWIHPPADGCLGCLCVFAGVNSATVNNGSQLSPWDSDFVSFGYILRYGIPGSHSSPSFRFLMNVHTVSYSGGSNLYSHQQYTKVLFSPHPILVSSLFDDSHSNKGEVIPHCGFDLHFPND